MHKAQTLGTTFLAIVVLPAVVLPTVVLTGLALLHGLAHQAGLVEVAGEIVEHAVDVASTTWGGVELGQIHIFIDGHGDGNGREGEQLGNGDLHDDDVHVRHTREIPVARVFAHVALIGVGVENGGAEELACKFLVFNVGVLGQQLLLVLVLRVEALDGLQHEGVDHVLVVVPIEALLLEEGVDVGIVLDELLVETAPQLAVLIVGACRLGHVLLIDLTLFDLIAELAYKLLIVVPCDMLVLKELIEHLVLFELGGEPVEYEFLRRNVLSFPVCLLGEQVDTATLFTGDSYDEVEQIIVKIVCFGKTEKKLLFSGVNVIAAVLIVCVG